MSKFEPVIKPGVPGLNRVKSFDDFVAESKDSESKKDSESNPPPGLLPSPASGRGAGGEGAKAPPVTNTSDPKKVSK